MILNENPVAVVLSDHRMPGMSGVDFLYPPANEPPGSRGIVANRLTPYTQ